MLKKISILSFSLFALCFFCGSAFSFDEDEFLLNMYWDKTVNLPKEKRPKIALVLGGGGGRGFAHIGVLKLFQEEKIPVDLVIGTSIGAVAGAFYCSGIPMEKAEELSANISWGELSNKNVFSVARMLFFDKLLSNAQMEKFLNLNLGAKTFQQLTVPLICVATDINTGERILLRDGSVAFAARASATIPGLFAPVPYRQRLLVDGGLTENIPVNVAKLFDADIIIAVALSADITKNDVSSVFAMLMQSIYIQGRSLDAENLALADIVIKPNVSDISAVDLSQAGNSIDMGFIAARESLKKIKTVIIQKTDEKYLFE
jgi:NTE family protein